MFRPLTYLEKQRVTTRLFVAVALGAVFTVAAPTLFPCPVVSSPYNQQIERDDGEKLKDVKKIILHFFNTIMFSKLAIKAIPRASTLTKRVLVNNVRSISSTMICKGGDHHAPAPIIVGPGAKDGEVPSDIEQAAGLARIELLSEIEGREFFDLRPIEMTHLGTKKNPIVVESHDNIRYVGCTGYPVDSHDTIWLTLEEQHEFDRCPECGSVYKLKTVNPPEIPHGSLLEHNGGETVGCGNFDLLKVRVEDGLREIRFTL
ncbi:COX5B-domain-containing protein [Neoconidiobolus thromboides FSU 785]|nr:COX5B-domain-containing protein [Neoconidiobolus thromboides FSU 785]